MTDAPQDDLIDAAEAARILEVDEDRIQTMIEEDLLHPVGEGGPARLRRSEVQAVRELGG